MATVDVVYTGPHDEVTVPEFGLDAVRPGESVKVTAEQAERLCLQEGIWALVVPSGPGEKPSKTPPGDK